MLARHRRGNSDFVVRGGDGTTPVVVPEKVGTTQWHFRRAYEDGAIDSDELETVRQRYENLDSDAQQEFDDLVDRNGDAAVRFAARSDSETFNTLLSPCGSRSAPSGN